MRGAAFHAVALALDGAVDDGGRLAVAQAELALLRARQQVGVEVRNAVVAVETAEQRLAAAPVDHLRGHVAALEEAFKAFGDEIAAVIIEPVAGNMGVVPPERSVAECFRACLEVCRREKMFDPKAVEPAVALPRTA